MAKKRDLKKSIQFLTDDLAIECILLSDITPNIDLEKSSKVLAKIFSTRVEFLNRVNGCADKDSKKVKHYYQKLKKDFATILVDIMGEIRSLHKEIEEKK